MVLLGSLWFLWKMADGRGEEWRNAADDLPNQCDVVLVGSSLIAAPLQKYEFSTRKTQESELPFHLTPTYRAIRAEKVLAASGAGELTVYNSAAIGQDIGSTEKLVSRLIELKKRPRLIVLFIAPLVMVGKDHSNASIQQDISVLQLRFHDFCNEQRLAMVAWSEAIYKAFSQQKYFSVREPGDSDIGWKLDEAKSKEKYRRRVGKPKLMIMTHILNLCREHSIQALIVSTPVAPRNRALFSGFTYESYLHSIKHAMAAGGVTNCDESLVDLGQSSDFIESTDFQNGTHCNANGCEKMLRAIAPSITRQLHDI